MQLIAARIHPLCRLWLENRLHHTVQSSPQASHCRQAMAGQTARFRGRAGLRFNTVRRHLGPTGGMTKTSATACCLAKDWWTGGSLSLRVLLLLPGPVSSSQHKTLWLVSGPNWPLCSSFWALEFQSPTFQWGDRAKCLFTVALDLFQKTKSILPIFSSRMWCDLRI